MMPAQERTLSGAIFVRLFEPSSHFLPDFMNSLRAHADIVFVHGNVLLDFAFGLRPQLPEQAFDRGTVF